MEKNAFSQTLAETIPTAIVFHYKPVFEEILTSITQYQSSIQIDADNSNNEDYLADDAYLITFCHMVYDDLDSSVSSADLAIKLEAIAASNDLLVGCLERIEEFSDKTGEYATQNKITRRLLQNIMSFVLYSLGQITKLNSDLEQLLLEKSDSALIPYGFGE